MDRQVFGLLGCHIRDDVILTRFSKNAVGSYTDQVTKITMC